MGSSTSYVLTSLRKLVELGVLRAIPQSRAAVTKKVKALFLFMLNKRENKNKINENTDEKKEIEKLPKEKNPITKK